MKLNSRGLPGTPGTLNGGGLEDADRRVVPEQHVGDRVAGEADVEAVAAEESRGEVALQPPAAIVEAEVQRVTAA